MKRNKHEIEITKENCEGYCELYKNYNFNDQETQIINKAAGKTFLFLSPGLVVLPFAGVSINAIALASVATFILSMGVFFKTGYDVNRKKMNWLKAKYPHIDVHASFDEVESALRKANVLKFTNVGKTTAMLDLESYNNFVKYEIRSEQVMIDGEQYDRILIAPISEHRFSEEVKVKVKTKGR